MDATVCLATATDLLHREAALLDDRQWDDWLALYDVDAEFWVPAWNGNKPTDNPAAEVSLIYTASRSLLADRVARFQSGRSPAANSISRTAHMLTNIIATHTDEGSISVRSLATTHTFSVVREKTQVNVSRYEHLLVSADAGWHIRRKKVILLNNIVPEIVDFYTM